jgi:ABC-type multidrug transport system fused ATPase/permease subunit
MHINEFKIIYVIYFIYILYKSILNMREIELDNIIKESLMKNKDIFLSSSVLLCAYWLQDVVFTNNFSKITTNITEFIDNLGMTSIISVSLPFLISEILYYLNDGISSHVIPEIEITIVNNLVKEIIESVKTSKTQYNTNILMMNLKKVLEIRNIYHMIVSYIFPTVMISIGLIYYMSKFNSKAGLITAITICVLFIITYFSEKSSMNLSHENTNSIDAYYDNIHDVVGNIDTVIVSSSCDKEINALEDSKLNVCEKYVNSKQSSGTVSFKLHMLSMMTIFIILGCAVKLYINKETSKETLISTAMLSMLFVQYYDNTITKTKSAMDNIGKYKEMKKYFSTFKINDDIGLTDGNFRMSGGKIELKNVSVKYDEKYIFENLNHIVSPQTKVGLIGDMGSGKSSLLKILGGLTNYEGSVIIDGQDISKYNQDDVMKHIAYIPQHPKFFNRTILENMNYGIDGYTEEDIWNFLEKMEVKTFFEKFPKGLNTMTGKDGSNLSGGQKQITAIMRALLQDKKILLIDEPTSSLDETTKNLVMKTLKNIKDKTILIVTHDKSMVDIFDDFIFFGESNN